MCYEKARKAFVKWMSNSKLTLAWLTLIVSAQWSWTTKSKTERRIDHRLVSSAVPRVIFCLSFQLQQRELCDEIIVSVLSLWSQKTFWWTIDACHSVWVWESIGIKKCTGQQFSWEIWLTILCANICPSSQVFISIIQ